MGRLHPWVFHAPKVPLGAGAGFRVVNGPHFKPESGPSLKYIFEARFRSNAQFMCIACLSMVMLQNVMFLKKKNYHETIKDGDTLLQNELSRIAL